MALQQLPNYHRRQLIYGDTKGSGLLMVSDPLNNGFSAKRTLIAGRLTDAARAADSELVLIPGARIRSLDSGILYESNGSTWVSLGTGTNDDGTSTATQMAAIIAGGGGGGGGSGIAAAQFTVPNGGNVVITMPGPLGTSSYAVSMAVLTMAGATGSYSQSGHVVDGVLPPLPQFLGSQLILERYTNDGWASGNIRGIQPGDSIGTWAWNDLRLLSATTYNGCVAETTGLILDVDGLGTARTVPLIARNGRWQYLAKREIVRKLNAPLPAVTTAAETLAGSIITFPQGLLQGGDELEFWFTDEKAADNGVGNLRVRFGTSATFASNPVPTGFPDIATAPSGTQNSYATGPQFWTFESATALRNSGNGGGLFNGSNAASIPATFAVTNVANQTNYLSIAAWPASASDSLQVTRCTVIHHMAS